jgi:hypothetical protein
MEYKMINSVPPEDREYILYLIKNNLLDRLNLLGEGSQGSVYEYKNYAIKYGECLNDGKILEKFQDNPLFIKLYFYGEDFIVTEKLEITNAYEYYDRDIEINYTAEDIFNYCRAKGHTPYDIHDENVVIANNQLKIIDVGAFGVFFADDEEEHQIEELNNIILHVKMPPIAI